MSPKQQPELEPGACAGTPPQQTLLDAPAIMYAVDNHTAAMPAAAATTTAAPTAGPSAGFAAPDPMEATTSAAAGTRAVQYTPERLNFPKTDACALPPDVATLELEDPTRGDAHMHEADADLLGSSAPDDPLAPGAPQCVRRCRTGMFQCQGWYQKMSKGCGLMLSLMRCSTIAAGIQYLLQLPSEVLGNHRSGSGQKRRAAARMRDLRERSRAAATLAAAARFDTGRSWTPTVGDHALAGRIHQHVREGDSRVARCLDSSPIAAINDSTIEQLKALHPTPPPPLL